MMVLNYVILAVAKDFTRTLKKYNIPVSLVKGFLVSLVVSQITFYKQIWPLHNNGIFILFQNQRLFQLVLWRFF